MNPARKRGAKKETEATLPGCPQVRDGRHLKRTLLASSKGELLAHFVWINAVKVKAPRLGGLDIRRNFCFCSALLF